MACLNDVDTCDVESEAASHDVAPAITRGSHLVMNLGWIVGRLSFLCSYLAMLLTHHSTSKRNRWVVKSSSAPVGLVLSEKQCRDWNPNSAIEELKWVLWRSILVGRADKLYPRNVELGFLLYCVYYTKDYPVMSV